MTNKKHNYQSEILALPPLKMVLGDVPDPDPDDKGRPRRAFSKDKSETEARNLVTKLIGHLKNNEK
jgi:hypothetical protein